MRVLHVEAGRHLYGGAAQVGFLLKALPDAVDNHLICTPDAAIAPVAERAGAHVHRTAIGGDLDLGFIGRMRRIVKQVQPDIVHLHSRRGADTLGILGAAGRPIVCARRVDNREGWLAVRLKYPRYDRVIAISQGIADVLTDCGVDDQAIEVVRSTVDAPAFQTPAPRADFLAEFDLPDNAVVIGVAAQLIERKGHAVLFDALSGQPWPDGLRVICFGQGPQREALEALVRSKGLETMIQFTGFRDDLSKWLGNIDFLAHPALAEGMGVILLQAAAAGVCAVASRVGGIPEAVVDEATGLLVPPGDSNALRAAIQRLIDTPALRDRFGHAARLRVEQDFSPDQMAASTLDVYKSVLGAT